MRLELSNFFLPPLHQFLLQLGQAAHDWGSRAFIVGGMPRDLLRGVKSVDLDILIEGDAIAFAKQLKQDWASVYSSTPPAPTKHLAFKRYGTAKLIFAAEIFPGLAQIDFASTRAETYPTPGSAPVVQLADLNADLRRRDFSINSIAIELSPDRPGLIHDPFGGRAHLEERRIAILHERSFVDDPARLIRAVRFATRLGFDLDSATNRCFEDAISMCCLESLPVLRREDEFRKALNEPNVTPVILQLNQTGLLSQLIPGIVLSDSLLERLRELDRQRTSGIVAAAEYQKLLLSN